MRGARCDLGLNYVLLGRSSIIASGEGQGLAHLGCFSAVPCRAVVIAFELIGRGSRRREVGRLVRLLIRWDVSRQLIVAPASSFRA